MAATTPTTATKRTDRTIATMFAMMFDLSKVESNCVEEDNTVVTVVMNNTKKKNYTQMRTTLLNDGITLIERNHTCKESREP